jgi:ribosomal protein S18 acetylase RimI-like enzyme
VAGAEEGWLRVRAWVEGDAEAVWQIFRAVVAGGDTYAYRPETGREEALALWPGPGGRCFVAVTGGRVVGTYVLRANQPGLGAHVANAAFMVDPAARGRGVGRAMGEDALVRAAAAGYRAMQFNLVVASNLAAIALWRSLGFAVVGRLPGAFHRRGEGDVDALVMYRSLAGPAPARARESAVSRPARESAPGPDLAGAPDPGAGPEAPGALLPCDSRAEGTRPQEQGPR